MKVIKSFIYAFFHTSNVSTDTVVILKGKMFN